MSRLDPVTAFILHLPHLRFQLLDPLIQLLDIDVRLLKLFHDTLPQ